MKPRSKFVAFLLFLVDLLDLLMVPVIFTIVGLIRQVPWQFYVVTIGGYFGLVSILELLLRYVFSTPEKKQSTRFFRKLEKMFLITPEDLGNSSPKDN